MPVKGLVLYSGSTDVTGAALAEALGFKGAKKYDGLAYDAVLCWGFTGLKDPNFSEAKLLSKSGLLLNKPSAIRLNSNKLKALTALKDGGVSVPKHCSANAVKNAISSGALKFPIIGRKLKHQGGTNFHYIAETAALDYAISEGCEVFSQYVPKKSEYRIHVVNGKVVQICKKTHQDNPVAAWKALKKELAGLKAEKQGVQLHGATMDLVLDLIVGRDFLVPNYITRSNTKGWKFANVDVAPAGLTDMCIKAAKVLGLDFAAIDCIVGEDNANYILEANTGPGLETHMMNKYKTALEKAVQDGTVKVKAKAAPMKNVAAVAPQVAPQVGGIGNKAKLLKAIAALPAGERAEVLNSIDGLNEKQIGNFLKLIQA